MNARALHMQIDRKLDRITNTRHPAAVARLFDRFIWSSTADPERWAFTITHLMSPIWSVGQVLAGDDDWIKAIAPGMCPQAELVLAELLATPDREAFPAAVLAAFREAADPTSDIVIGLAILAMLMQIYVGGWVSWA